MTRKQYSKEEKLSIIKEASEKGVMKTLSKYNLYAATYYDWKKKLSVMGEEGLNFRMTPPQLKRIRELEKENLLLKQIIAEKSLEEKMREQLIKKKLI